MQQNQDRDTWLKWRHNGIGSSDASAVHNKSPYKTRLELVEEKILPEPEEQKSNWAMEQGNKHEPLIRKLFAAEFNLENLSDENFAAHTFEMEELPFMKASADGWSSKFVIGLEAKFQGKEAHLRVADEGLKICGFRVPEHYWIQCQHLMLVTGAKHWWFASYNPNCAVSLLKVLIPRDETFLPLHLKACSETWEFIKTGQLPEPSEKDYKVLTKKGAKALAKRIMYLKENMSEMKVEYDTLSEALKTMCDHPKMRCLALRIIEKSKKGSIDYLAVPEIAALNLKEDYLEKHRKPGSKFREIRLDTGEGEE